MGMTLESRIKKIENWIEYAKVHKNGDVKELEKTLEYLHGQARYHEKVFDNLANCYSKD